MTNGRTTFWPEGTSSVFSRLPHHDLLTYLAVAQTISDLPFFNDPSWNTNTLWRTGAHGAIHSLGQNVVKRIRITDDVNEKLAYRALICELLVYTHPVLKHHRNIQFLQGVMWDIQTFQGSNFRVMPALFFEKCDCGTLAEFMSSTVPFMQRLGLCEDIGRAIEAMHAFNIIHGDIKPDNILIYRDEAGFTAKVIDFGCSCFGAAKEDKVLLSRTFPWAAPELCDTPITIKAAMQADIYSYGKVCAWILFGQELSVDDFARLPFNFNQAVSQQRQRVGTGWEELRDRPAFIQSMIISLLKEFFERSFQDFTQRREEKIGLLMENWEKLQKYLPDGIHSRNRHQNFTDSNIWSILFPAVCFLMRLGGRLAVLGSFRSNSEVFIPGPPLLRWNPSGFLVAFSLGTSILIYIGLLVRSKVPTSGLNTTLIATILGILLLGTSLIYSWEFFLRDLRQAPEELTILGRIEHTVPDVGKLFWVLNEAHYLVREQLLSDLKRRARSGCTKCRDHAALQLALCYSTAFGTPRNVALSTSWLEFGHKSERDLKRLYKEAEYQVEVAWGYETPMFKGVAALRTYECHLPNMIFNKFGEGAHPAAILRYRQEIDGRIEAGICLRSVATLHSKLGDLYFSRRDYKLAENHFREALKIENEMNPHRSVLLRRVITSAFERSHWYAHLLAMALDAQEKGKAAIETLNGINLPTKAPKEEGILRSTISKLFKNNRQHNEFLWTRELLVQLLIKQNELDKVLNMNPLSVFAEILNIDEKDSSVAEEEDVLLLKERSSRNIAALADSLSEQGRRLEAAHILRQRQKIYIKHYGASNLTTIQAMGELTFLLSKMLPDQVQEALSLEFPILGNSPQEANNELLLLRTIYAFALSKSGLLHEAIAELNQVLHVKERKWTQADYVSQGCLSPLADTFGFHGCREWKEPALMQQELLSMLKQEQCPKIQESVIALLCALARIDGLKDSLTLMRHLVEQLRLEYPDQWSDRCRIQGYLVFTLSSLGLCFQDANYLNEALCLGNATKDEISQTCGLKTVELFDAVVDLASVYSKKSIVACHFHGFNLQDLNFMRNAEGMHQLVVDIAREIFGDTHEKTTNALIQLHALIGRHAIARAGNFPELSVFSFNDRSKEIQASLGENSSVPQLELLSTIQLFSETSDHLLQLQFLSIEDYFDVQGDIVEMIDKEFEDSHDRKFLDIHARKRMDIYERQLTLYHPLSQAQRIHIARMCVRRGRVKKAWSLLSVVPWCHENYYLRSNGVLTPHPQIIRALETIAQAFELDGASYISLPILKSALQMAQKTFRGGDAHPSTVLLRLNLLRAISRAEDGCPTKRISNAQDRLKLATETFGQQQTETIGCMNELAEALLDDARKREALRITHEALELGLPLWNFSHPMASRLWKNFLTAHNRLADSERFRAQLKEFLLPHLEDEPFRRGLRAGVEIVFAAIERLVVSRWALGPDHYFTKVMGDEVKSLTFHCVAHAKLLIQKCLELGSAELPDCERFNIDTYMP